MKTRRLRKCVPLKVTAHIFMFLAFFAIMAVLVYGILYVKIFIGSPAGRIQASEFSYYSTNLFYEDYSQYVDRMINLINVDLPDPLSPTMNTNSPRSIFTETPFKAA